MKKVIALSAVLAITAVLLGCGPVPYPDKGTTVNNSGTTRTPTPTATPSNANSNNSNSNPAQTPTRSPY